MYCDKVSRGNTGTNKSAHELEALESDELNMKGQRKQLYFIILM